MDRRVVCYSSFLCLHSSILSRRIVCCLSFFCLHSSVLSRRIVCYSSFFSRHSSTSRELNSWKERMTRSYLENVLCLDPLMIEDKSWTPRRPGSGSDYGAKTRKTVGLFYNSWFMIHTLSEWWSLKRKCPWLRTKFHGILWSIEAIECSVRTSGNILTNYKLRFARINDLQLWESQYILHFHNTTRIKWFNMTR